MTRVDIAILGSDGTVGGPGGSPVNGSLGAVTGVTVVTNGSPQNAQSVTDGAMTSASAVLQCSTSTPFGSVQSLINNGYTVLAKVAGAGNAGGTQDLCTTVASVQSTGQVTLSATCANTTGVTAATVAFGVDWTTVLQNALNTAGDAVVRVPAGSAIMFKSLTPTQATLDLTGVTHYQSQPLNKASISNQSGTTDIASTNRFHLVGGIFIGTGNEQQNNVPLQVTNIADARVRDTIVIGYQSISFYFTDCQGVWIDNTSTSTNGTTPGQTNYFVILYAQNGTASNAPREIFIRGNYVSAPNSIGNALGISSSNVTNSNSAYPVRLICTSNNFDVADNVIGVECGGTGSSVFYLQRAIFANNIITNRTSTGTDRRCINVRDDSTTGSTDPNLITDVMIVNNVGFVTSIGGGWRSQATRGIIGWNTLRMSGTSTMNAIACDDHNSSGVSSQTVIGNLVSCADGANNGGTLISFSHQNRGLFALNQITYDTGATGCADAVQFLNCTQSESLANMLYNLPGRAVRFTNCTDCKSRYDSVFNPCTATGNAAVYIDGASSAGSIWVIGGIFHDNRGAGAKMTYAINNAQAVATCYRGGNFQVGAVTASSNGTWTALTAF